MNRFLMTVLAFLLAFLSNIVFAESKTNLKDQENSTKELRVVKKLNINQATIDQLVAIKGIGKSKAKAIVAYIKSNGQLKKVTELKKIKGIGSKLFGQIQPYVTVE